MLQVTAQYAPSGKVKAIVRSARIQATTVTDHDNRYRESRTCWAAIDGILGVSEATSLHAFIG